MITPLTVRLDNPDGTSLQITRSVSDLSFKSISPGGFASVQVTLKRPLAKSQIAAFSTLTVFDGTTGETVGGGRILTPDRSNGDSGEVSQISCLGEGLASMQDRNGPLMYVDSTLDNWVRTSRDTKRLDASNSVYPGSSNDEPALMLNTSDGTNIVSGVELVMTNKTPSLCGMNVGGFGYRHKSGANSASWGTRGRLYTDDLTSFTTPAALTDTWSTSMSSRLVGTVASDFTNKQVAAISWKRTGADITAIDNSWDAVRDPIVRSQIYATDGTLRSTGYTNEYILLSEAFIDLLTRRCPRLDATNASVVTTSHHFDQLVWLSGITAMGALEEMLAVEAAYTWHVWEKQSTGLYRTELVAKPTEVRYEATVNDGFSSPAPNDEVYNVVYVTWTSPNGRAQVTRVPTSGVSPVADLDAAGIVRSATIALATERGSTANATKAGTDFLAGHAVPPNSGTVTVSAGTKIRDNFTGRLVPPWRILPNELIRVRGVQPTPDSLNVDSPDGVTVFRIVSNEFSDSAAASTLELDDFVLDESRALANLVRQRHAA